MLRVIDWACKQLGLLHPVYSIDNASPHAASLRRGTVRGVPFEHVHLPAHAPDMNKVVEHMFPILRRKLHDAIYSLPHPHTLTARQAQALLWDVFEHIDPSSIAADVASLPLTLKVIATEAGHHFRWSDGTTHIGSGGNWPDRRYR